MPGHNKPELISSTYNFVRGRQLEGTYSADPTEGIWPITSCRIQYGWGAVLETSWPRVPATEWPPKEPQGLDDIAKSLRILFYQRVRNLSDCKRAILQIQAVGAAFEITNQWFNAPGGKIEVPCDNDKIIGAHAVCLTDFNDDKSEIEFVNSWGDKWGDKGFGYMPYSYFEKYFTSGWILCGPGIPRNFEYSHDINYVNMGFRSVLSKAVHVKEIFDAEYDERLGWAICVQRDSYLDIEDIFVRPPYRNRGFGRQLCNIISDLSAEFSLPIRIWFSHADDIGKIQQHLCRSLGLTIIPSGVCWAHSKAVNSETSSDKICSVPKPCKPRSKTFWESKVT